MLAALRIVSRVPVTREYGGLHVVMDDLFGARTGNKMKLSLFMCRNLRTGWWEAVAMLVTAARAPDVSNAGQLAQLP
ncbi:hypothetical protein NDU88_004424 [Pleurodeles waltl]|uniref:Uncharacterized protein n=1 Tax=Pleurodeles waltl TaxID=8319 RepID=A0AAV7QHS4_PLEWA|nr:hypothetical protein NDU88_004424 [Pleurodeles waltl]